jgi:serine/threonine protein kinase
VSKVESPVEVGIGSVLAGRYRLDELVGEGGMARVYRAEDLSLERTVAVKVMRESTDGSPARVRSETTLLASLSHPSLVTLYDAHTTTGAPSFLVMEYVEGHTLSARLAEGPLAAADVAALGIDLAEALHVVHEKGVVHRDIKPSNILMWQSPLPDRGFRAKLTDFGIAYLLDSTRVTSPGTLIGTAAYLAPEQVRGEIPSPAADIYSLGLVLLESLTGRRPFGHAVGHEAIVARLASSPEIPDDVPGTWRTLIAAMTASDPARRPTALQVAVAATALRGADAATADISELLADPTQAVPLADGSGVDPTGAQAALETPTSAFDPLADSGASHVTKVLTGPSPLGPSPSAPSSSSVTRRRLWTFVAIVAGILLAGAVVAGVLIASQPQPEPPPALPTNGEPLGTDLQNLLEEVTP